MTKLLLQQDKLLRPTSQSLTPNEALVSQRAAESAVRSHTELNLDISRKVHQNLDSQCAQLDSKLNLRRNRRSSLRPALQRHSLEPDLSAGTDTHTAVFEVALEKVLETYILEKIQKKKQVEREYELQKEELIKLEEGGESSKHLIECILNEMDRKMKVEVSAIETSIEIKRKSEISALRKRFGLK